RLRERLAASAGKVTDLLDGWPVAIEKLRHIGHSTGMRAARRGPGQEMHFGIDLAVPAGTDVLAPESIRILHVVDGTQSSKESSQRAGLFVEAVGKGGRILRFLHLAPGSVTVKEGQRLTPGQRFARVGNQGESGVDSSGPHLHFEVR